MRHLFSLNKYFVKYKWYILGGIAFVILANMLQVYNPTLVRAAIDNVSLNLKDIKSNTDPTKADALRLELTRNVLFVFLKYIFVALLSGCFKFMMRQTIIVVSRLIEFDLKNEIYAHYQKLDLAFFRRNNTGDLMNRITEDVSRVRMYVGPAIMYTVNLFFTTVLAVSVMVSINKELAFYVLIPLPFLSIIIFLVNRIINRISEQIQAKLSDLTTNAQETYSGIRVVQAYVQEKEMISHFEKESEEYKKMQMRLVIIDSIYFPVMTFLIGLSLIITIYVGGIQVGAGKLTTGHIAEFILYVQMLMWPVSSLGWVASMIQRAAASQRRINEFLHYQPSIENNEGLHADIKGDIEFRNVSFTYPDTGIKALRGINFHIKAGQRWAIIGRTGSGKSTVGDLLMRMYDTTEGQILIDGADIRERNLGNLRRQIGFVPQDVFLFSENIYENIAFGKDETIKEEAKQYAEYAAIGTEIESFAEGYETIVGERGVTLSGGQKQRISIARALIKKPNVLVLDDCLSAVDAATEKRIQQNLDEQLVGKTAVIITHRIFSLIQFDKILVMENGLVVEQGTHEQLLRLQGVYAGMYEKQQLEQTAEVA